MRLVRFARRLQCRLDLVTRRLGPPRHHVGRKRPAAAAVPGGPTDRQDPAGPLDGDRQSRLAASSAVVPHRSDWDPRGNHSGPRQRRRLSSTTTKVAPTSREANVDQHGLVDRARRGDRHAFAELARASGARLDATARLILRDPDLAQDAVQETLIRAWRGLPGLRDPATFDHWLHSLVAHACIDLIRKRRRRVDRGRADARSTTRRRSIAPARSPTATCSIAPWPGSSRRRGPSSSCTSISTCRCRGSPRCSASRSGRRSPDLHRSLGAMRSRWPIDEVASATGRARRAGRMTHGSTARVERVLPALFDELAQAAYS